MGLMKATRLGKWDARRREAGRVEKNRNTVWDGRTGREERGDGWGGRD